MKINKNKPTSRAKDIWLTMKETQELLDYSSRNPVYDFCRSHKVKITKPRGRVYFNYVDLMNALEDSSVIMEM